MAFAFSYYIISFIVSLINPFWGLVGFVCSLLLRFQDHYPEVAVIKPFTLLLFGLILSCIINSQKLATRKWEQDKKITILLVISIFGLLVMAPSALIGETYLFICSISMYYFATRILQTPTQFLILFLSMGVSIAYLAITAIEAVALDPANPVYIDLSTNRWQGVGYYANSNEFGQLMITTVPFLYAAILVRKSMILTAVAVALMIPMIYVMAKCESRTVMITLGLMTVGTFMLRGNGNLIKKAMVGAALSGVLIASLSFIPGPLQDRLNTVRDANNDESFQGRTRAWGYGFDMVSWYPVTGVGKGQWGEYHGLAPHNSYVQVMAELGLPGIWVFLLIIWLSFKQFKPILSPTAPPDPIKNTASNVFDDPPTHGDDVAETYYDDTLSPVKATIEDQEKPITNFEKTIAIATFVTFCGWLLYIFLGNQGYSVWTYFYIGLCAATGNFLPQDETPKNTTAPIFTEESKA